MAVTAVVEDGKIVNQSQQKKVESVNDGMDKDAFLQLLVAQMQYQDPLEPTSNTEYISQYAQFSQVQQIQNMAGSLEFQRANALVGKEVYVKYVDSYGISGLKQGKVDYVVYDGGKPYLAVDEKLYELDDLDTVADKEYFEAFNKAYDFVAALNKLPNVAGIDLTDAEAIDKLEEIYNGMSDYEKGFLAKEKVEILNKYIERLKEVRLQEGVDDPHNPDPEDTDPTE